MIDQATLNRPLKDLCTLGIGGPARSCLEVRTIEEMQSSLIACHQGRIPYLILGKGSNSLFDDRGFDGLVLLNKIGFYEEIAPGIFHVGAGYSFSLLGVQTARKGWSGLEFASGIPGSVGGAVFMNAGANGTETSDTLVSVDFIDEHGQQQLLKKEDLCFSYRTSPFQKMSGAIVGATFQLTPSLQARHRQMEMISYRMKTQPYQEKSAGCIFRNCASSSAGALIDRCGLKGLSVGGAKVSELHANFIINAGEALATDVLTLIALIQAQVKEQTGIELESEIRVIPY
jgi:UDP-N-acetylmuramate dehydrogenase